MQVKPGLKIFFGFQSSVTIFFFPRTVCEDTPFLIDLASQLLVGRLPGETGKRSAIFLANALQSIINPKILP
jgi:hypothetical protein